MKVRIGSIVGLSVVLALFLVGTATAQKRCENVNAHLYDLVDYSAEPACTEAGYGWCAEMTTIGTLNGRILQYALEAEFPEFGDTFIWRGPIIFETKHGTIFTDAVSMNFQLVFFTLGVGRVQQTALITGGTGRYEDATGVITATWEGPDEVVGELSGEICWPEQ